MELTEGTLLLSRELSDLDRAVIEFCSVLDECGIDYVIVSGYVAILTGRSRSTEDIDIILERMSASKLDKLAHSLDEHGYWGMAMPLTDLSEMLSSDDRLRVAEEDQFYPNFEIWLASNDVERKALSTSIVAALGGAELAISSIELQIAYKLRLAQASGDVSGKDFEDALHLYLTFEDELNTEKLERYVSDLGVSDHYARLRGI